MPLILPPPLNFLPVVHRLKTVYALWHNYHQLIPKTHRYTLAQRIDTLFIEVIEAASIAGFLPREEKQQYVQHAIRKLDTSKVLLLILWETHSLDTKRYTALSLPLEEIGKMLGGWNGQLQKQNSPSRKGEK